MSKIIKEKDQAVTEQLLQDMVGEYINVPTNPHKVNTPNGSDGTINAWFAGRVAGYEKAFISYDYDKQEFLDEPNMFYNVLLCDGMGYIISQEAEVEVITEENFHKLVADFQAEQVAKEAQKESEKIIQLNDGKIDKGEPKKIILPGEDK